MKIPKDAKREARRFFRACFTDGLFDEAKARATVQAVARQKPRHYLAILSVFQRLVRLEVARNSAQIESATELPEDQRVAIRERLQQLYHRPLADSYRVTPRLIGGARVTVGSDVWDGSVANRLEMLKAGL